MRSNLDTRVARLETTVRAPRMFTVAGPAPDYDAEGFLRSQGYNVRPRDIVVQILRFGDCGDIKLVGGEVQQ